MVTVTGLWLAGSSSSSSSSSSTGCFEAAPGLSTTCLVTLGLAGCADGGRATGAAVEGGGDETTTTPGDSVRETVCGGASGGGCFISAAGVEDAPSLDAIGD